MQNTDLKKSLLSAKPFQYLDIDELDRLIAYCKISLFMDGEVLCKQGKKSDGMYIIIDGKALITAKTLGKNAIKLATLDAGNFFGEISLIEKGPCATSAIASGNLKCMLISTAYFDMLEVFFPETKSKILKALTEEICVRLKAAHKQIIALMNESDMVTRSFFSIVMKTFTNPEKSCFKDSCVDIETLKKSEFFNTFTADEYDDFLKYSSLIKTAADCVLINEGENDSAYYTILCGAVRLTTTENNKTAKIAVLGPMDIFGSISYINNTPSIITYTTCERAILLKISMADLLEIKNNNINLWHKIYNKICRSFVSLQREADKLLIRLSSETYNR